jgi:hypothetical protein
VRSGPGAARTILLFHIISARPSKQPLMVRTFLKVYIELGSYFLFLQEQIKDIIIIIIIIKPRLRVVLAVSKFHAASGWRIHCGVEFTELRLRTKLWKHFWKTNWKCVCCHHLF